MVWVFILIGAAFGFQAGFFTGWMCNAPCKDAADSGKVTWNVHWDGARGPIATRWAVQSFPTVYVIDPEGRIAARNLRGKELKEKVEGLLK